MNHRVIFEYLTAAKPKQIGSVQFHHVYKYRPNAVVDIHSGNNSWTGHTTAVKLYYFKMIKQLLPLLP